MLLIGNLALLFFYEHYKINSLDKDINIFYIYYISKYQMCIYKSVL